MSGVTPICWTTSVTPATVGVPSPQPPTASTALTSATVASVLGSVKVASTNRPVSWSSTAVKFLVAPVIGRSVIVKLAVRVTCVAVVVKDVGRDRVNARLGVGVAAGDVERRRARCWRRRPTLLAEPSPQSMVPVKSAVVANGVAVGEAADAGCRRAGRRCFRSAARWRRL